MIYCLLNLILSTSTENDAIQDLINDINKLDKKVMQIITDEENEICNIIRSSYHPKSLLQELFFHTFNDLKISEYDLKSLLRKILNNMKVLNVLFLFQKVKTLDLDKKLDLFLFNMLQKHDKYNEDFDFNGLFKVFVVNYFI
ncbi:hypothetical protein HERIO_2488 [Hepatospora eriocheir]|uniref:Uncharacterized protein n=1 Tax=Hepatospora eriocheir TaxID=1081669 RepID=A0A1X0Q6S5_9MICR|nr:hypothetical protein HERIO_2488 [Hepatospora eriocheir]